MDILNLSKTWMHENRQVITSYSLKIAAVVFFVGVCFSIYTEPELLLRVQVQYLSLLFFIFVPASVIVSSFEYYLTVRAAGVDGVNLKEALKITIISSAANMLPLPGGVAVRIGAMKGKGVSIKKGAYLSLLTALLWVAITACVAAFSIYVVGLVTESYFVGILGFLMLFAVLSAIFYLKRDVALVSSLALQRIVMVALDAIRMYLCLLALGVDADLIKSGLLVVGSVAGSAVSVVPAGLGIREFVTSMLAPVIGVTAAAGFMAASLNRIVGLLFISPLAFLISKQN